MRDLFRIGFSARMSETDKEAGELMLYGEIAPDGWKWSESDRSATDFDKAVKTLKKDGARKLNLRINSPGGAVYEAIAMRSVIAGAGFDEVHIKVDGMCASAATLIATLPGADVEMAPGSTYMIHNPWTMAMGNADEFEKEAAQLRQIEKTSRDLYAKRTGQTDEWLKEKMDAETWFTAEDAVDYGFADRVSEEEGSAEKIAACVNRDQMALMRQVYRRIPESLQEAPENEDVPLNIEELAKAAGAVLNNPAEPEDAGEETDPAQEGSTANPVAGFATVNKDEEDKQSMDIKELTLDQLCEANPALLESIRQDAAKKALDEDRARREEIDALTMAGYEELAEEAKNTGMSAADFVKAVAKAQKEKGSAYLTSRAQETAPAANIAGGAPQDSAETEEQKMDKAAADIARYANEYRGGNDGGMY